MTGSEIIQFQDVVAGYGERTILEKLNYSIHKGEFVYLVGSTGSGKSTLLKLLYADMQPTSGRVTVGKYNNGKLSRKEVPFLRRQLGIVFQDYQLLPDRSVTDNIVFVMKATGWKDSQAIKNRASDLLMQVGLSGRANALPHQLSGGEQQRVAIARALVNDPLLLLADEPTGNLDPAATRAIMDILFRINLGGTAILMATHDHNLIKEYPARTLELHEGQLIDHPIGMFQTRY